MNKAADNVEGSRAAPREGVVTAVAIALGRLGPAQRRALLLLFSLMVAVAGLDAVGVGAILPLVAAVLQPATGAEGGLAGALLDVASALRERGLVPHAALAVFVLFLAKNIFAALVMRWQTRFVLSAFAELSSSLLERYLRAPWRLQAGRSTAELLRNITDDARALYAGVLLSALFAATHVLTSLSLLGVLLALDWRAVAVSLVIVGAATTTFYALLHARTATLARRRRAAKAQMNRWVQEALSSVKEAKLGAREAFFAARYREAVDEVIAAQVFEGVVRRAPRLVVETVAVGGVAFALALLHGLDRDPASRAPLIAAFGVALARLVPALHNLTSDLVSLRQSTPAAAVVDELLLPAERTEPSASPLQDLSESVRLEAVRVRYPGGVRDALVDVSLEIRAREALALVGASGAGKTTLADVVLSLIAPDDGRVLVDGRPVAEDLSRWRAQLGYIPQRIHLLDDSVRRNVAFGAQDSEIDDEAVWRALARAELSDFVRALPGGLASRVGERGALLSGGQQQRLGIARALYLRPRLLVMDEATSALDTPTERTLCERLLSLEDRPTLLVIAHRASTARRCDRVALLHEGKLVAVGHYQEMLDDPRFARLVDDEGENQRSGVPVT